MDNGDDNLVRTNCYGYLGGGAGSDIHILSGDTNFTVEYVAFNVGLATQVGTPVRVALEGFVHIEAVVDCGSGADAFEFTRTSSETDTIAFDIPKAKHGAFAIQSMRCLPWRGSR